jgi:hypothetical protein
MSDDCQASADGCHMFSRNSSPDTRYASSISRLRCQVGESQNAKGRIISWSNTVNVNEKAFQVVQIAPKTRSRASVTGLSASCYSHAYQ